MWGVLMWWAGCALAAWIGYGLVTMGAWMSCDSAGSECYRAAEAGTTAYKWVAIAGFGGLLAAIMLKPTKRVRIVSAVLITVWVPLCLEVAVLVQGILM